MADQLKFDSDFLNKYLQMVEDTESPRIMHIMAALTGIAACLGRRVFLQRGHKELYSNLYVALVGPPGARKSTAMDIMRNRVEMGTGVRFAPDDTAGQRQGLIKALRNEEVDDEIDELLSQINAGDAGSVERLLDHPAGQDFDPRDKHTLFVTASEFNSFLGDNAKAMLTFLIKMYDGDSYKYQLKTEELTITDPLMNIIGCTTPTNIATALPPEAIGQGFMSRVILVYANKKYKKVPEPQPFNKDLVKEIENYYHRFYYELNGEMGRTPEAAKALEALYDETTVLDDPRFVYYIERRYTHLLKLSIILAASRLSKIINTEDVRTAATILRAVEITMPDALGEYGLSKVSAARQKLVEFLQHAKTAVSSQILFAVMARDMTLLDFNTSLADLVNAGKIQKVHSKEGDAFVYVDNKTSQIDDILAELIEKDNVVPIDALARKKS